MREFPSLPFQTALHRAAGLHRMEDRGRHRSCYDRLCMADNRFVTLTIPPSSRVSTPVVKKNLNPTFPPDSSTFDFPLYLSLASVVGGRGIEGVMWDKVGR